ncbi:MAG TPA: hypothetical protein DCF68_22540, partial [Cyanothece sp. UBA12306]|nr:hypothetical protein [Cyanothece sp. UBA12306]
MNKTKLFLILGSLATCLLAPINYAILPESLTERISNHLLSQALEPEEIRQQAEAISVRVKTNNNTGSGVIIGKAGNTYTVMTNAHVIQQKVPNKIVTIDGEVHDAKIIHQGNSLEGNDLGILTFNSAKLYQVATLVANPNIEENLRVYSVGFPEEMKEFYVAKGLLKIQAPKPFIGGYRIGYDVDVKPGMSGGALLNNQGQLIGINGLLKAPILNEAYTYVDGSKPFRQQIENYRQLSFAIPIETLVEVAPNLALIPSRGDNPV